MPDVQEKVTEPNPDIQRLVATGKLFHALASDPRYRKEVLGIIKKAAPDTMIPELDMEGNVLKAVEERIKPNGDEMKKLNDKIDTLVSTISRESFRKQHGLADDELVEIEELAKKEQIGNGATAVELWRLRTAPGTPRGTRKAPVGTAEYLTKLSKVDPRNQRQLRVLAEEEASRIFSSTKKAS